MKEEKMKHITKAQRNTRRTLNRLIQLRAEGEPVSDQRLLDAIDDYAGACQTAREIEDSQMDLFGEETDYTVIKDPIFQSRLL
jgi:hypothetical protein